MIFSLKLNLELKIQSRELELILEIITTQYLSIKFTMQNQRACATYNVVHTFLMYNVVHNLTLLKDKCMPP